MALYHYACWSADNFLWLSRPWLELLGIYAVDAFFVISGFSLCLAYTGRDLQSPTGLAEYAWRRFVRLYPLWITVLTATIIFEAATGRPPRALVVILNASGLFALCPHTAIPTGGWSIGVEISCYLILPLLVVWVRSAGALLVLMLGAIGLAWITTVGFLDPAKPLPQSWRPYTAVSNHFAFFAAGITIARLRLAHLPPARTSWAIAIVPAIILTFLAPHLGDQGSMSTGWNRLILGSLTVCLVAGVGLLPVPTSAGWWLRAVGDLSFGIYLLHPLCWRTVVMTTGWQGTTGVLVALGLTLTSAAVAFRWLEAPAMRISPPWRIATGYRSATSHQAATHASDQAQCPKCR